MTLKRRIVFHQGGSGVEGATSQLMDSCWANRLIDDDVVVDGQIRNGCLVSIQYRDWHFLRMCSRSRSGGREVDLVVFDDGQVEKLR